MIRALVARGLALAPFALALLSLALTSCDGAGESDEAALRVRTDARAQTCELSFVLPPEASEPSLLFGASLLERPWTGRGAERLAVALDADGFAPVAPLSSEPERLGLVVPMGGLRAALAPSGRFAQARWKNAAGEWVLGSAWHLRDATEGSGEPVIAMRRARAVASQRASPRWLELLAVIASVFAGGLLLRRLPVRRCAELAFLGLLVAWLVAWPRAVEDFRALHWHPPPELLRFFERVATRTQALPRDVGVEVDGPASVRCYASAAMPTARLAHRFLTDSSAARGSQELRRFARLGPDLTPNADEVLVESQGEWSFLAPRSAVGAP